MRSFRILLLTALAMTLTAAIPTSALAWKGDGAPVWPRGVVTYHAMPMSAKDAKTVRDAVAVWNRSGARLRLVPAPKRRANIVVMAPERARGVEAGSGRCDGVSRTTFINGRRVSNVVRWGHCREPLHDVRLVAHEIGHSLGLDHERSKCALMSSSSVDGIPHTCRDVMNLPKWQQYCVVLEADDVRGIVALYGGRARIPTPRVCTLSRKPAMPVGFAGDVTESTPGVFDLRFTWTNPASSASRVQLIYRKDTCPTQLVDEWNESHTVDVVAGEPSEVLLDNMSPGTWCGFLVAFDQYDQPSDITPTVSLTIPEPDGS